MPEILAFVRRAVRARSHISTASVSSALLSAPLRNSLPKAATFFLLSLLVASSAAAAPAPRLLLSGLGNGALSIDGPWQFHTGDDPAWASPAFDDGAWESIQVSQTWEEQGHTGYTGYAWYRRHIDLGSLPSGFNLGLMISRPQDVAGVYWNGDFVDTLGQFPPHPVWQWYPPSQVFSLPLATSGVLAIRVWKSPITFAASPSEGGIRVPPLIGGFAYLQRLKNVQSYERMRGSIFDLFLNVFTAMLAVACLAFWLRSRSQWMLFWLGISLLLGFYTIFLADPTFRVLYGSIGPVIAVHDASVYFVLLYLLGLNGNRRLVRFTAWLSIIILLLAFVDTVWAIGDWMWRFPRTFLVMDIAATIPGELFEFFGLYLAALVIRRRLDFARWFLVVAVVFNLLTQGITDILGLGTRWTHWSLGVQARGVLFTIAGNDFRLGTLSSITQLIAILYAAWRYSLEQRQRQNDLELEQRNARAVQQVLIPETIPQVPGFAIESFYEPAGEVGGDFFQILATRNGGVLAVIGDVSGKGMPAAMTVSLLVGTVRTLAHYTDSPGEILAAMNQRMLGRSQGGFTTCLVLRADADGTLAVANAGHIAPYLAGHELRLENGLPLGLAAEAIYAESIFQLSSGAQLTMLTDGIVEARENSGALFGFERTAALSLESAEAIAAAAQQFGQDDDITVLTLTRLRVGNPSTARNVTPILSPA
jgi:Stage II sporulation protein E (SpoIIE)